MQGAKLSGLATEENKTFESVSNVSKAIEETRENNEKFARETDARILDENDFCANKIILSYPRGTMLLFYKNCAHPHFFFFFFFQ